jgi:tetratricopeptide (TPR) repeat protein
MTAAVQRYLLRILLFVSAILFFAAPVISQDEDNQKDPVKLYQQGQDAHEKGDLKTALEFYNEALKIVPEFPEAEFQKGTALVSLGRLEEAEGSFRRALELRADWTPPMNSLGALLVKTGRFPEAEALLTRAVKLDDNNSPAYTALADLYLKSKASPEKLKSLLAQLQVLTAKMRPLASTWVARAAIERALGDSAAAKTSAGKALILDPKNLAALHERAEALLALGDSSAALNDANSILKLSPDLLSGKLLLAGAQVSSGDTDEALKTLDSVGESAKQTPEYKELRQAILSARSDSGDNLAELEKLIAADPKSLPVLARLCSAARKSDPARALDYCRRAAELDPANVSHAIGYAAALVQARQFDPAVQILRRLLSAAPENFTAHANLATALFELKRYPEAITEFEWLIEKKSDLAIAYYFLGIAYDSTQKYPEAMAHYQKFLSLADSSYNKSEIENVNLRLPALAKQIEKLSKKSRN